MNTRTSSVCSVVLILMAFLASAVLYARLPDIIPIHWNVKGEADGFGSKTWAVWLTPGLMVFMFPLFRWLLPAISPRKFDVTAFRDVYDLIVVGLMVLLLVIHLISLRQTLDDQTNALQLIFTTLFLFFAVLGNVMGKIRRNLWMGIRVPWTIASERVWNDTHRVAAWLWVVAGLLGAGLAWFNHLIAACVALAVAIIFPIVYSYNRYKTLERQGELERSAL